MKDGGTHYGYENKSLIGSHIASRLLDLGDSFSRPPVFAEGFEPEFLPGRAVKEIPSRLRAFMPEVEPKDLARALERMGCSWEFYLELLGDFVGHAEKGFALLEGLPEKGSPGRLTVFIHSLKCTLAAIGAMSLSGLAEVVEEAVRAEDLPMALLGLDRFRPRLAALLSCISRSMIRKCAYMS
ncbi:MAG: Hpt domain-containing protein [Deltaproteobacteria bacterium]|nr:Hpt domain-containing protein [Deltaproteobacteria bacterium]